MESIDISWFEIPVTDINRAVKFYNQLFDTNISIQDLGQLKMGVLPTKTIGGALVEHSEWYKPSSTQGALIHLYAGNNLSIILDKVEEAGGKILIPKRQISEILGYMAVILDSEGNRIALRSEN